MVVQRRSHWLAIAVIASLTASTLCQGEENNEIVVNKGNTTTLPCHGNPGSICFWTDASGVFIVSGEPKDRYSMPDRGFERGDCSLTITNVVVEDSNKLTCDIRGSNSPKVTWNLIIGNMPSDPVIEYANKIVQGDVPVYDENSHEERINVTCTVRNGIPLPKVTWRPVDYGSSEATETEGDTIKSILTLDFSVYPSRKEQEVICISEHQLYEGENTRRVQGIVGIPYPIQLVKILHDTGNTAVCTADGIPRPEHYKWQFKAQDRNTWDAISVTETNITLSDTGFYKCLASTDQSYWVESQSIHYTKDGITDSNNEESSNTQQAGMIVGIVIAALVVICIISGLTLFTFRRKALCFKDRSQQPQGSGNVENGGKIQTINSPDGREKSDLKGDQNENTKQKEVVYAQLNLPQSQGNISPKSPKEKTEYAQIKFTPKENQV